MQPTRGISASPRSSTSTSFINAEDQLLSGPRITEPTFSNSGSYHRKLCCCLRVDIFSRESEQLLCGWDSCSVPQNSRCSHHNFNVSWIVGKSHFTTELKPTNLVTKSKPSHGRTESKSFLSCNPASANRYPFQYHHDKDMSFYIEQYRKTYVCQKMDEQKKKMGGATTSPIKPKIIMFGSMEDISSTALARKTLRKKLVCYHWYVITGMLSLVCYHWYVITGMLSLVCHHCYVGGWVGFFTFQNYGNEKLSSAIMFFFLEIIFKN